MSSKEKVAQFGISVEAVTDSDEQVDSFVEACEDDKDLMEALATVEERVREHATATKLHLIEISELR